MLDHLYIHVMIHAVKDVDRFLQDGNVSLEMTMIIHK